MKYINWYVFNLFSGFYCFCIGDFYGQFCENIIPLCQRKINCYNGGTCDYINQKCLCSFNYTGKLKLNYMKQIQFIISPIF